MDVQLYVYDLSQGLARQYSRALTGIQIDAVYHTAIVLNNVEYFFGQGIHRKVPGTTHHGRPIQVFNMGTTELPLDVIDDYIQSLESVYTPESYDLFLHNCNNFTQDLALFLVGKSIPQEISSLPETFLSTPIGRMLRSQIDQSMRTMTQAPDAAAGSNAPTKSAANGHAIGPANGAPWKPATNATSPAVSSESARFFNAENVTDVGGEVYNITVHSALNNLLAQAKTSCAIIFFTSATCPPCKMLYPTYDALASELGSKCTFIKVDVSQAHEIGGKYSIRATPTFITFLHGTQEAQWSGADSARLNGDVRLLVQMAHPPHPHSLLGAPAFHGSIKTPILYAKSPPLEKIMGKLSSIAEDPAIKEITTFVKAGFTSAAGQKNTPAPSAKVILTACTNASQNLSIENRFAFLDLMRLACLDPRTAGNISTSAVSVKTLLSQPEGREWVDAPYNLRIITCQLACNLFSSPVFQKAICDTTASILAPMQSLAQGCLLAEGDKSKAAAAALVYNICAINHNARVQSQADAVSLSGDLKAALITAVYEESSSKETLHGLLMALGCLLYMCLKDDGVWELCEAFELRSCLQEKAKESTFKGEGFIKEVVAILEKGGV